MAVSVKIYHYLVSPTLVAISCITLSLVSLQFFGVFKEISQSWLSSGFLLALLLFLPIKRWVFYLIAGFIAFALVDYYNTGLLGLSLGFATASCSGVVVSLFSSHAILPPPKAEFPSVSKYFLSLAARIFLAAPLSALIMALIFYVYKGGYFAPLTLMWWFIVSLSLVLVPTFVRAIKNIHLERFAPVDWKFFAEYFLNLSGVILSAYLVFKVLLPTYRGVPFIASIVLPFIFWGVLRFGMFGTSSFMLVLFFIISKNAPNSFNQSTFLLLLLFLIILTVSFLILAEALHRRLQAKFERDQFFTLSSNLFCLAGFDGLFKMLNPAWESVLGYSLHEMINKPYLDFIHPDDHIRTKGAAQELIEGKNVTHFENRYRKKDGGYRWFRWDANSSSQLKTLFAVARDVTEEKMIEEDFHKAVAFLHARNEATPFGIIESDIYGDCIDTNAQYLNLVKKTLPEVIGKGWLSTVHPDDRERVSRAWYNSVLAGTPFEEEYRIQRDDGTIIWLSMKGVAMRDEKKLLGYIQAGLDISKSKDAQERLTELKESAEAASRAKADFLAKMSHEIRTPMNGVLGMAQLLMNTELKRDQDEYVQTIYTTGNHLLTIINDILDFSKIESGKLKLEEHPFSIKKCIEEAVDLVLIKAIEKKIELLYLIDPACPKWVIGDNIRLCQILINLFSNALKFTESGEVFLRVYKEKNVNEKVELRFTVSDTGIGIDEDKLDLLFQAFSQVDSFASKKYGGTGLGLVISSQLAKLMQGHMWVESKKGTGTTFYFTIQCKPMEVVPESSQEQDIEIQGKKVLIVDDNATSLEVLSCHCHEWGLLPTTILSSFEALSACQKGLSFDLAIIDDQMPGLSGHELIKSLRSLPAFSKTPIILLMHPLESPQPEQEPHLFFLTKPVKMSSLFERVRDSLSHFYQKTYVSPLQTVFLDPAQGSRYPLNILLAEDDPVNQKLTILFLEKLGYKADVVNTGNQVLESIKKKHYDLIFMDMQMPDMDGIEATQKILELFPKKEDRPTIIAITASAMPEDKKICLDAGMDDYMSKPISLEIIAESLKTIGSKKHS